MEPDIIAYLYAMVLVAGGVIGFVKKASYASLAMGLFFGVLMGYGAAQTSRNANNYTLSLIVALAVLAVMGHRFVNSGKVMPAGLVAAISLLMVIRYALRAIK